MKVEVKEAKSNEVCCNVLESLNIGWMKFEDGTRCMPYITGHSNEVMYRVNFCPSCGKEIREITLKTIDMKLQQGDYVTNLTEEQFDELLDIENHKYRISYAELIKIGLMYDGKILLHDHKCFNPVTELQFEEFKQRAINTFKG